MPRALLLILLSVCSCTTVRPPAVTRNMEREVLETVVSWDAPQPGPVVLLAAEFLSQGRGAEGFEYFRARHAKSPSDPLLLAMEGFFQAVVAPEVFLFKRIAWVEDALGKLEEAARLQPDGPAPMFRALVMAKLPARFGRAEAAVAALTPMVAWGSKAPRAMLHNCYLGLAQAHATLGHQKESSEALALSGYSSLDGEGLELSTFMAVNPYALRTGVYKTDGAGMEIHSDAELGAALNLIAGGDAGRVREAAESLYQRGDFSLCARVASLGLTAHPDDPGLRAIRQQAWLKLISRGGAWDFLKFAVYSERAGVAVPLPPPYAGEPR